jgi:hypothetical protein
MGAFILGYWLVDANGDPSWDTSYSYGQSGDIAVMGTLPATFPVYVSSSPPGLPLTVDGTPCTATCTFQWTPGSTHTVAAAGTLQGPVGTQYAFAYWSDYGAASHSITVVAGGTTLWAFFATQYYLTTTANPPAGGTISPSSGWQNYGQVVPAAVLAASLICRATWRAAALSHACPTASSKRLLNGALLGN